MLRKTREFLFLHTIGILEKNIAKRKSLYLVLAKNEKRPVSWVLIKGAVHFTAM